MRWSPVGWYMELVVLVIEASSMLDPISLVQLAELGKF